MSITHSISKVKRVLYIAKVRTIWARCELARYLPWYDKVYLDIKPGGLDAVLSEHYDGSKAHLYIHTVVTDKEVIKAMAICPEEKIVYFCKE